MSFMDRLRHKATCFLALLTGFLLLISGAVSAGELDKVRVVTSIFPPFSYSENGEAKGVAVDQARLMFAELGISPKIEVYPWARAYTIAEREPNVLIFSMGRNAKREPLFKWLGEITGFDVHIYRSRARPDLSISALADLKKHTVLGLIKDIKADYLRAHDIKVSEVRSEDLAVKMLLAGRADLMASDRNAMNYRLKNMGMEPGALEPVYHIKELSNPLYAAFSINTDDAIVARFKAALEKSFGAQTPAD